MFSIITSRYGMALAALVAGAILFLGYGVIKYREGQSACVARQAQAQIREQAKAAKDLDRVQNETQNMSDDAINADLIRLGVMRPDTDR